MRVVIELWPERGCTTSRRRPRRQLLSVAGYLRNIQVDRELCGSFSPSACLCAVDLTTGAKVGSGRIFISDDWSRLLPADSEPTPSPIPIPSPTQSASGIAIRSAAAAPPLVPFAFCLWPSADVGRSAADGRRRKSMIYVPATAPPLSSTATSHFRPNVRSLQNVRKLRIRTAR